MGIFTRGNFDRIALPERGLLRQSPTPTLLIETHTHKHTHTHTQTLTWVKSRRKHSVIALTDSSAVLFLLLHVRLECNIACFPCTACKHELDTSRFEPSQPLGVTSGLSANMTCHHYVFYISRPHSLYYSLPHSLSHLLSSSRLPHPQPGSLLPIS